MRKFFNICIVSTVIIACYAMSANAGQNGITLRDALDATMESQLSRLDEQSRQTQANLGWLDGAPIVSARYYHNQTAMGSKEAEISLSFPIKTALKRQVEESLKSSSAEIKNNATQQFALHYSGVLRNIIWDYQQQKSRLSLANHKQQILASLLEKYKDLAEFNAIPNYTFLLLQKEFNDSRILSLEYEFSAQRLLAQYSTLSGLQSFPDSVEETLPEGLELVIAKHPAIQSLDATWAAQSHSFRGQSKASEPWNINLSARRIETLDFSENQLGIGIDMPLSIGQETSISHQNEYLQAKLNYEVERNRLLVDTLIATQSQQAELQFLAAKQALLEAGHPNLNALESSINQLLESNSQEHAVHIRNLIELFESRAQVELNRIAIQRQIARIKQAAGIPL